MDLKAEYNELFRELLATGEEGIFKFLRSQSALVRRFKREVGEGRTPKEKLLLTHLIVGGVPPDELTADDYVVETPIPADVRIPLAKMFPSLEAYAE